MYAYRFYLCRDFVNLVLYETSRISFPRCCIPCLHLIILRMLYFQRKEQVRYLPKLQPQQKKKALEFHSKQQNIIRLLAFSLPFIQVAAQLMALICDPVGGRLTNQLH